MIIRICGRGNAVGNVKARLMGTYKDGLVWCQCKGMGIDSNKYKMQDDSMGKEVGMGMVVGILVG
jgi:hypothetical protein